MDHGSIQERQVSEDADSGWEGGNDKQDLG